MAPLIPNAETIEAMEAARRGEVFSCNTIDELMDELNRDDEESYERPLTPG